MSDIEALDDAQVTAYLARIGVRDRPAPDLAALRDLHVHHLRAVPFENLSIHLGEPIVLATATLFDKIVVRRRGGFCYEVNGLFAALLTALGYHVDLLGGGVYGPHGLGPPFDHAALAVDGWLVDVGFGRHSAYPLEIGAAGEQADPCGVFRIDVRPDGDLEVTRAGVPQYRLEGRPRELSDFGPTCWWQQTQPDSHFRTGPICSRLSETFGQITLAGRMLTVTEGDRRDQVELPTDTDICAAYRDRFGITLTHLPTLPNAYETSAYETGAAETWEQYVTSSPAPQDARHRRPRG